MTDIITSPQNQIIKHVKSLYEKSKRDKLGQFFVEGLRIVEDALLNNAEIEFVVVSESSIAKKEVEGLVDRLKEKGSLIYEVSDKIFKEISDTETPQGILTVVKKPEFELERVISSGEFLVLLENIQDPGNMGTIIRTADAAGASGIILSKGCVDICNPKVLRSTMGSIFHLPIIKVDNFEEIISNLNENGFNVLAAHLDGQTWHFDVDMRNKTAVVIGNEANGISDNVAKECKLTKIPMLGKAESLNASVSAGIIIYEYVRQKMQLKIDN